MLKRLLWPAGATEPQPWQWPQLPNPFGHRPQLEAHLMHPQHTVDSPMPASLSHNQPQQVAKPPPDPPSGDRSGARSTGISARAAQDGPAAQRGRAAQTAWQPFWVPQPWRQKHADKEPAANQGKVSRNAFERKRNSAAGAEHHGIRWSFPRLRNPFDGWGRLVSPGDA
jgi:hypothetical protein